METIIIKARTKAESKTILDFLKKKNLKASVHKEPTKKEILHNIEQGAREVRMYLDGKLQLREAKELLDEL